MSHATTKPRLGSANFFSWAASAALLLSAFGAIGCDSCQHNRPYTPFRVDASPSSAASSVALPSASAAPASPAAPVAVLVEARKLEPPTGRITVGPREIELPSGLLAERLLERPSSQAGQLDGLVWVVPAKPDADWNGPMGELWSFPAGADAKKLVALPGWMPSGTGCVHETRLAQLGSATVLVDVTAKCERSLPQRTPVRALMLLAPDAPQPLLLGLRVADTAADEALTFSLQTSDRDGDGREDPVLRVDFSLNSTGQHSTAELGWLDRPAGASVDERHLVKSIEPALAAWEAGVGKKAKQPNILTEVAVLRRLLGSLCQQSGVARLFDWRGEAIRCPQMTLIATRLAKIEVRAALGLGDPLEAAHRLAYASHWHGGIPTVDRDDLGRRIEKSLSLVKIGLPVATSLRPAVSAEAIHYSPLAFESAAVALLVQADRGGLQRVTPDGAVTPIEQDAGIAAWPMTVMSPDGKRWVSVVPACDRSELSLAIMDNAGRLLPLLPTRLLAPRPGVCRNPAPWPLAIGPIGWLGESPVSLIDGVCWSGSVSAPCSAPSKLGPFIPGSPRSPDGRRMVVVTSLGPMVVGGPKTELWSGAALANKTLSDCVVASDAAAIACIANGTLLFVTRPEITTPKPE